MITETKRLVGVRGGNRHPVAVKAFIQDYLGIAGEDYVASIHRAYKAALDQAAISRGRKYAYHKPTYHSFEMVVLQLAREGVIEFSGREEESDSPTFINMEPKPKRRYYRLATGASSRQDGHKALETGRTGGRTGRQGTGHHPLSKPVQG